MENRLNELRRLDENQDQTINVKVAVTTMAFDNREIIALLRERADYIKKEKWDKMREVMQRINDLKRDHFHQLITPCSIFITFESEEGSYLAKSLYTICEMNSSLEHLNYWLTGKHTITIKRASEPSDIIWENRR